MRSQAKAPMSQSLFLVFVGEKKNTVKYLGKEFNHSIATFEFFSYCSAIVENTILFYKIIYKLLDEVEQNAMICQWGTSRSI